MPVELTIRDGNPWWLSPDLWIVPGSDPAGSPGVPLAGQPAYLYAHVTNAGTTSVQNASVRFYWADPSVGFDRNTAHLVGTSFVTLGPGSAADVLCLTPWVPQWLNEGHECVVAEAFHPSLDPLPASPAFDVPSDRHVAQRNLSVLHLVGARFHLNFTIFNPGRKAQAFQLIARQGDLTALRPLLPHLGPKFELSETKGKAGGLGFVDSICPDEHLAAAARTPTTLAIPGGGSANRTLVGAAEAGLVLIHVEHRSGEKIVGGLSVLVVPAHGRGGKEDLR